MADEVEVTHQAADRLADNHDRGLFGKGVSRRFRSKTWNRRRLCRDCPSRMPIFDNPHVSIRTLIGARGRRDREHRILIRELGLDTAHGTQVSKPLTDLTPDGAERVARPWIAVGVRATRIGGASRATLAGPWSRHPRRTRERKDSRETAMGRARALRFRTREVRTEPSPGRLKMLKRQVLR